MDVVPSRFGSKAGISHSNLYVRFAKKRTFVGAIDASKLHWLMAVIAKIAAPHASRQRSLQ
jgi:hypothetical protein